MAKSNQYKFINNILYWICCDLTLKPCIYYNIQGPQTQSVKSNSSILAYLNVIKTTFLIFSCTKHLHNSFCIHFDALWCILMHSEHLEKNWSISTKKMDFFQIKISYTKLKNNSFCIHFNAFWCIQMHFDAFYPNQI